MLNKLFCEDCNETIKRMPDDYLDLTVTSPPYNVNLTYDKYNDNKKLKDYLNFLKNIFEGIYSKTKDGGRCAINIGDKDNGKIPTHSLITNFMIEIGWLPLTTIIWDKGNVNSRTA